MQHILTQDEIDKLVPVYQVQARDAALEYAKKALLKAAKFKCIHDEKRPSHRGYCDDCPCSMLMTDHSKLLCTLSKDYSK